MVVETSSPISMDYQLRGAMPRNSSDMLFRSFAGCIGKAIQRCAAVIFVGCPQVTQLVVFSLLKLGYQPVVRTGEVLTWEREPVTHVWVELPEADIRIETNPSQIFGLPVSVLVTSIQQGADRYKDGKVLENWAEFPALLLTPAGEAYFDKLSDQVVSCLSKKSKRKR